MNIRNLDQASLCVLDQNLHQNTESNLQGFNEQVRKERIVDDFLVNRSEEREQYVIF